MDDGLPQCVNGCGELYWADDQWICLACGDEFDDATVNGSAES